MLILLDVGLPLVVR